MVSGLWTEGEKASGQIDKAVWTHTLSTNTENGALREKGHLSKQAAEGHEEALAYVLSARELRQDSHGGVLSIIVQGKVVDELRKWFYAWWQTSSDGCPALVLLSPTTEMRKDFTRKPRDYLSCSFARLQTHTHAHAHAHACTHTQAYTHLCQCPTEITSSKRKQCSPNSSA